MGNDGALKSYKTYKGWQITCPDAHHATQVALATANLSDPTEQTVFVFHNDACGVGAYYGAAYKPERYAERFRAESPAHELMDAATFSGRMLEMQQGIEERLTCNQCGRGLFLGPAAPIGFCVSMIACPDDNKGMNEFLQKKAQEYNAKDGGRLIWRFAEEASHDGCDDCIMKHKVMSVKRGGGLMVLQQGMQLATVPLPGGGVQQVILMPPNAQPQTMQPMQQVRQMQPPLQSVQMQSAPQQQFQQPLSKGHPNSSSASFLPPTYAQPPPSLRF